MIKLKRLVIAAVAAAIVTSASFAQEVVFENKLQWGIVDIGITDDNTDTNLSAFTNKTKAEYSSEKLDLGAAFKFSASKTKNAPAAEELAEGEEPASSDEVFAFGSEDFIEDVYIEFRPVDFLGIGFHRGYAVAGSYLPCLEKELDAANIGSDFGLFVRPIEGLVVAGGLDFISIFGSDDEKPLVNFGAEYTLGEVAVFGAAVRNVASNDDRSFGVYASYFGLEGLTVNAGFTYNGLLEEYNVAGNLLNAAVMFNKNGIGIFANAVFAVGGEEDFENELYAAANISYMFETGLFANVYGGYSSDFDNDDSWAVEVSPGAGYSINEHNTVGASVFFCLMKDFTNISFPVYWKYNF